MKMYRILIPGSINRARGDMSPLYPASNWMSERAALRFAREWQEQFPNDPVKIASGRVSGAALALAHFGE